MVVLVKTSTKTMIILMLVSLISNEFVEFVLACKNKTAASTTKTRNTPDIPL